jgi:hypothetical protein
MISLYEKVRNKKPLILLDSNYPPRLAVRSPHVVSLYCTVWIFVIEYPGLDHLVAASTYGFSVVRRKMHQARGAKNRIGFSQVWEFA